MTNISFYQDLYKKLFKFSLMLVVIFICFFLFLFIKKIKEPLVAYTLMENVQNAAAESILFEILDASLTQEELKEWIRGNQFSETSENESWKSFLKHVPVLKFDEPQPLEAYLSLNGEEIPFKNAGVMKAPDISWDFVLKRGERLHYLDARDMIASEHLLLSDIKEGRILYNNGSIRKPLEFRKGIFEFVVRASSWSNIPIDSEIDPLCQMNISLNDELLGSVYVPQKVLTEYRYRQRLESGWHSVEISFVNDFYNKVKNFGRDLLVKDVQIYEFNPAVSLTIKTIFRERYLPLHCSFIYFSSFEKDEWNDLIRFFKVRFNIESLKDIISQGYGIGTLLKNVQIGHLTKHAIFAPAPTRIRLSLKVPAGGIKLVFSYGIMEEAWDKPGDGVEFTIKASEKGAGSENILFSRYINPKSKPSERRWFHETIDLKRYKGKEIRLTLETHGSQSSARRSLADDSYDWSVWGE